MRAAILTGRLKKVMEPVFLIFVFIFYILLEEMVGMLPPPAAPGDVPQAYPRPWPGKLYCFAASLPDYNFKCRHCI